MPKIKDGQVEVNSDKRRGVNNSGWSEPTDTSDNEGILSAHGSSNDYGHNHGTSNSSGNRRNRGTTGSQSNLSLGPFTETASKAIDHMSTAYKALQALSESYKEHVRDIEEVSTTKARCIELENMCKIQKDRIRVLKEMGEEKEEEFAQEMEDIKKERAGLEAEKKKFEEQKANADKRARIQEAEQKNKQENELEKLKKDQDKHYNNLKQQLEQDIKKKEDEAKKIMTDLEAANKTLSEQVEAQKAKIKAQEVKLTNAQEEYDILRRAKDSFKEEKQELAKHLKMLEDDFALTSQPIEF
jgi:chromosome segregation ATPase